MMDLVPARLWTESVPAASAASLRGALAGVLLWTLSALLPVSLAAQEIDLDEDLRVAAQFGDLERVRQLIGEGASVNARRGPYGETPLMAAAQAGNLELVRLLIENGAELHARDDYGNRPLHYAFVEEVALLLLEHTSDVDLEYDDAPVTPLSLAAQHDFPQAAQVLLDRGAAPNLPDTRGETPLMAAAAAGSELVIRVLHCGGASLAATDRDGNTALDLARMAGHDLVSSFLESPSCDPAAVADLVKAHRLVREANAWAARPTSTDALYGEALELRESVLGATHLDVTWIRARLDERVRFAAFDGDLWRVRRLVGMGGSVNASGFGGMTALMSAAQSGDLELVRYLLEQGANPNARDSMYAMMPLQHAFVGGNEDVVILLLEHTQDVNATGADGVTALHAAAFGWPDLYSTERRKEFVEATYLLLERGADVDGRLRDKGWTPLMVAANREHEATVRLLYCYGASPVSEDEAGQTAIDIAARNGFVYLARYLESPTCDRAGNDALVRAGSIDRKARTLSAQGRYAEAIALLAEVLRLQENALGETSPTVAITLGRLAEQHLRAADLRAARALLEKSLGILEAERDALHPDLAANLGNLALVLEEQGDFDAARPMVERALAIMEQVHGPYNGEVAAQLDNLARLLMLQGRPAAADSLYRRVLEIRASAFEETAREFRATALNNFASLKTRLGDYRAADTLYREALSIFRDVGGDAHPNVARVLNQIGELQLLQGKVVAARPYLEESLAISERSLGPDHVQVAVALSNLAFGALVTGESQIAQAHALRAAEIVDGHIEGVLSTLSPAEQRAFLLQQVPVQTAILLLAFPDSPRLPEAYSWLLRWKGLLAHHLRRQTVISSLARGPDAERATELQRVRGELAAWHQRADEVRAADWRARSDKLTQRKELLERELARAASEFETISIEPFELSALRARLPAGVGFIDVYRYGALIPSRYGAVYSTSETASRFVDLGAASSIDSMIVAWRNEVVNGGAAVAEWDHLARAVWSPIATTLGAEVERAWISPDGMLARVPWSLLAASDARTDDVSLSHVGSARELAALLTAEPTPENDGPRSALLVGDIDFDAGAGHIEGTWEALPGTAAEIESLRAIAEDAAIATLTLRGPEATKEAVTRRMSGAEVVHLATHGFFYAESSEAYESRGGTAKDGAAAAQNTGTARNPLVESGIALAGANVRDSITLAPRGLLTAEELLGLELPTTDLVVLSACETGRGAEITGQGVMGLRASVMAAGARSMLMSLWKVPDKSTALLMEEFYRGLWLGGLTKAEALRQAQAEVREHPSGEYRAPLHWAAWVLAGEAW